MCIHPNPWSRRLQRQRSPSSENLRRTPPPPDQHFLPHSDAKEGDLDAFPITALPAAGLRPRPEALSTGRAGDEGHPRRRQLNRPPPSHLQNGALTAVSQETTSRLHDAEPLTIFAARQLQEMWQELWTHLYTTFVDLAKAFDTVNRDGLWKIRQKFGFPEHFTHMELQLQDGKMACVMDNGTTSKAFAVTKGTTISAMLMDVYCGEHPGIRITYRTDVHLSNSRHSQASTRLSTTAAHGLLFANDCAVGTTTEADMQTNNSNCCLHNRTQRLPCTNSHGVHDDELPYHR
ncbi:hypothetical protein SprV_0301107200 [Sparganum proliferum]